MTSYNLQRKPSKEWKKKQKRMCGDSRLRPLDQQCTDFQLDTLQMLDVAVLLTHLINSLIFPHLTPHTHTSRKLARSQKALEPV